MRLVINADLDNDAFAEGGVAEVRAMLIEAAETFAAQNDDLAPGARANLWDANGNRVGFLAVEA